MLRVFLCFLISVALFGCMSQQDNGNNTAIIGDDDFLTPKVSVDETGSGEFQDISAQLNQLVDSEELAAPPQDTDTNIQARTIAGTEFEGYACSIVNSPGATPRWAIHQYNLSTDKKTVLVAVNRNLKIQSVACSQDGELALFSMQESRGGDYEIYLAIKATAKIHKLTDNDVDDVDVTASSSLDVAAWQTVHTDGRLVININRTGVNGARTGIKILGSKLPFYQPSLSANGRWLVFTQLSDSKYRILRYQLSIEAYTQVSQVRRSKRVFHPSISDDGNLVSWVENDTKNLFWVKDVNNNTKTLYLNNANGIEHAMLTGDGNYVVYGVVKQRRTYIKHLHTTTKFQIGEVLDEGQLYLGASYSVPAWSECIDRDECHAYFTVVHNHVIRQHQFINQEMNTTASNRIMANDTIGLVFDLLAIKGVITEKDRVLRNKEALEYLGDKLLDHEIEQMSASYADFSEEYAKIWKDSTLAFFKAATTGRFDEAVATLVEQSANIVANLRAAWKLSELIKRSKALTVADATIQAFLNDGADLSNINLIDAESGVLHNAALIGIKRSDYRVDDAVSQLYELIGLIEVALSNIDLKFAAEGSNLVIFNQSNYTILYNTRVSANEECLFGPDEQLGDTLLPKYYKTVQDGLVATSCELTLHYQLKADSVYEEEYTYNYKLTENDFIDLQPPMVVNNDGGMVDNPDFDGVCIIGESESNNGALIKQQIYQSSQLDDQKVYQNTYLNRSEVGMEYFSETACDSVYHDNDPFITQDREQVHSLVDLPSHYLYSLEDYEWSDEEQRLLTRVGSFFGGVQAGGDDRTPLILIHGWQGGYGEDTPVEWFNNADSAETYWKSLISYMQTVAHRRFFAKKYKPYVFHYPSFKRVSFNGRVLGRLINSMDELKGKQVAIVAHSMGGLVARSWVEEHGGDSQLDKLITLATPHHGSPSAVSSWVDRATLAKSLLTPGALDLMWDNFDKIIQAAGANVGVWQQQRSDIFELDLEMPPFDLYYSEKVNEANILSNPWLTSLNEKQKQSDIRKKYYHYASFYKSGTDSLIKNDPGSVIADIVLDIVDNRYAADGVVPDMSGFNLEKAPPPTSIVYSKAVAPFYVKVASNNDRYIEDVDHVLFNEGIDKKFVKDSNQSLMLSSLLNIETIPGWGSMSNSNAYDPLFLMIKQDLGFQGVLGLTASTQNGQQTLTWDKYSGIRRYDIRYNEQYQGGELGDYIVVNNVKSPYVIPVAQDGVTRHYQIRYLDNDGFVSNWSNAITIGIPVVIATGKLNDTGITQCADGSTNGLSCPVPGYPDQDAQYGRDFNNNDDSDGHAGFSFTKLDTNGNELLANATEWSCVKDNVTGLIWEVKQGGNGTIGDEGLHDADDLYNWYSTDTSNDGGSPGYQDDDGEICHGYRSGNSASYCNTEAYTKRVNAQSLCGSSDWRLPSAEELFSLVRNDISWSGPTIDEKYFPTTDYKYDYWSSTTHGIYLALVGNFAYGYLPHLYKHNFARIRLVRGS